MKQLFLSILVMYGCITQAKFQLVTIYNTSDLKFEYAHHKENQLPGLTDILKKAAQNSKKHVFVDQYMINAQKGLAIRMSDPSGQLLDLVLDDQSTIHLEHNRKITKNVANFPKSCASKDGQYCARALLQGVSQPKNQIAFASYAHEDQALMNLRISGVKGSYTLTYEPSF